MADHALGRPVTTSAPPTWGDAWVSVTLRQASTLKRSEAYLPGWRATAVNAKTGKVVELTVDRARTDRKSGRAKGHVGDPLPLPRALHRGQRRRVGQRRSAC